MGCVPYMQRGALVHVFRAPGIEAKTNKSLHTLVFLGVCSTWCVDSRVLTGPARRNR